MSEAKSIAIRDITDEEREQLADCMELLGTKTAGKTYRKAVEMYKRKANGMDMYQRLYWEEQKKLEELTKQIQSFQNQFNSIMEIGNE